MNHSFKYPSPNEIILEQTLFIKFNYTIQYVFGVCFLLGICATFLNTDPWYFFVMLVVFMWWLIVTLLKLWRSKPYYFDGVTKRGRQGDKELLMGQPITKILVKVEVNIAISYINLDCVLYVVSGYRKEHTLNGSRKMVIAYAEEIGRVLDVPVEYQGLLNKRTSLK